MALSFREGDRFLLFRFPQHFVSRSIALCRRWRDNIHEGCMIPLWRCVSPDSVLGWFASPNSTKRVLTWRHFLFMFFRSP
jgi:hypothetical protein